MRQFHLDTGYLLYEIILSLSPLVDREGTGLGEIQILYLVESESHVVYTFISLFFFLSSLLFPTLDQLPPLPPVNPSIHHRIMPPAFRHSHGHGGRLCLASPRAECGQSPNQRLRRRAPDPHSPIFDHDDDDPSRGSTFLLSFSSPGFFAGAPPQTPPYVRRASQPP